MGMLGVKIKAGETLVLRSPNETTQIYFDKKTKLLIHAPPEVQISRREGSIEVETASREAGEKRSGGE